MRGCRDQGVVLELVIPPIYWLGSSVVERPACTRLSRVRSPVWPILFSYRNESLLGIWKAPASSLLEVINDKFLLIRKNLLPFAG